MKEHQLRLIQTFTLMISNSDENKITELRTCFFIFILVITGVLGTELTQPFLVLAQTGGSNDIHNITKGMDSSHKFLLEYNKSIPFIKADGPHWNVNVTTKATLILLLIQSLVLHDPKFLFV
jgi:hypothetical protein